MAASEEDNGSSLPEQRSIQVTKRTDRSLYMFLLQHTMKPFKSHLLDMKSEFPAGSPKLDPRKKVFKRCNVTERRVEEIYIYDLTSKSTDTSASQNRKRLYYFAGGGWQIPPSPEHWVMCASMAHRLPGITVSVVSYPLAPNSPAPVAFPQLMKLYETLLRDADAAGERVILAGDSAGGNLVLCLPIAALLEDENAPCPVAIMAMSPSTDLSRSNPDIEVVAKHDPILQIPFINQTAKAWRGDWPSRDPRVSPLFGDLRLLARRGVQVHGITGGYDVLRPDAILFREKCNRAGIQGEWLDWEKQMHCFPITGAFKLPEATRAMDWMLNVLRKC